jgi:hypothetical protein
MLEAAIRIAIDRGDLIYACSDVEAYHGKPLACDGEFFTILCDYEEDGEVSSDLWIVRMDAIVSLRQVNTIWNEDRFDRIGLSEEQR